MKTTNIHSYDTLPVGMWEEVMKIAGNATDNPDQLEDLSVQAEIIALLNDMSEEEVMSLSLDEYQRLAYGVRFLMTAPRSGDPRKVAVGGYRLAAANPSEGLCLVPCKSPKDMTTAQYIDFQTFATQSSKQGDAQWLALVLSCLLVPKGKTYCKDYDVAEVQDAIRQGLSVQEALDLLAFFLCRCELSARAIATSSVRTLTKRRKKTKATKK